MAEYIEREEAKRCVEAHYDDAIIMALNDIPAADVQPVRHGRWERYEQCQLFPVGGRGTFTVVSYSDWFRCSECGVGFEKKSSYCPNCGAKMDGGAE